MEQRHIARRVGAGLAAFFLLPLALGCVGVGATFAAYSAQAPDAFDVQGEICCDAPDTWGHTLMLALFAAIMIAIAVLLCAVVVSLTMRVFVDHGLPRKTLARSPYLALALFAVALPVGWIVDTPRLRADCETFRVQRADWRATDSARWRAAEAIARCQPLRGRRAGAVRRLLGAPDRRADRSWVYFNATGYDGDADVRHLRVLFEDGRVSGARFSS
jgi:hypothetical protein